MAIFNPILGAMRGRIAANVWSHNKGGDYVRLGTTPTNPNTSRQQVTRAQLGMMASSWSGALTQAQRDAWDVFASQNPVINSLGQEIYITGLAWFCKVNTRLADAGLGWMPLPPQGSAPGSFSTFTVDVSAATTIDVTFATALPAGGVAQVWASLPQSLGSSPNIRQCRLVGYSPADQVSPWAATCPHAFQTGDRCVAFGAVMSVEGLVSAYLQDIDDSDF